MPTAHTHINLDDVEDAAPENGFGDRWEARVARPAIGAEQTGVTHFRLRSRAPSRPGPMASSSSPSDRTILATVSRSTTRGSRDEHRPPDGDRRLGQRLRDLDRFGAGEERHLEPLPVALDGCGRWVMIARGFRTDVWARPMARSSRARSLSPGNAAMINQHGRRDQSPGKAALWAGAGRPHPWPSQRDGSALDRGI